MTFTPYRNKIEFVPIKEDTILAGDDNLLEVGTVVALGSDIQAEEEPFVQVGDVIAFVKWGVFETPDFDGKKHYVIECSPEFILGKFTPHAT